MHPGRHNERTGRIYFPLLLKPKEPGDLLDAAPGFSSMLGASAARLLLSAFLRPVQQHTPQQVPICMKKPTRFKPVAVHMNASIGLPKLASILRSAAPENLSWKMTNMTVAMTEAAAVNSSAAKVKMVMGNWRKKILFALCCHRGLCENPNGARKMHRKVRTVPTRKHENIQTLASLTSLRILMISVGRVMLAPARSSLRMISTGLNQYSVLGLEQSVMPWLL